MIVSCYSGHSGGVSCTLREFLFRTVALGALPYQQHEMYQFVFCLNRTQAIVKRKHRAVKRLVSHNSQ